MKRHILAVAAMAAGLLAAPQIASAATGYTTGSLNLRTCASVGCPKVATMPAGSPVWIVGAQGGWYQVNYRGLVGFASARYIAGGGAPVYRPGPVYRPAPLPPPPYYGYYPAPRYPRYGGWYGRPSGFYFGYRFGN